MNVKELLEFLDTKAFELQPTEGDRLSKMLRGESSRSRFDSRKNTQRKIFQVNEAKAGKSPPAKPAVQKCPHCEGNHKLKDCFKLKKESAKVRSGIIKALKLCFKCLSKHGPGMCEQEECKYCGGPHNILIC